MIIINKLTILDDKILYELDSQNKWKLDIEKIKFIGEYTTSAGRLAEDWFFVFADTIDQWWQAPSTAIDHEEFWEQLGKKLNCELALNLFASTNWATRVLYPKTLDGQELFLLIKSEPKPKTFWQKLFKTNNDNVRLELTENVKSLFK